MGPTSSKQETGEQNHSLADSVPTTLGLTPTLLPLFFLPSILPTHSLELGSLLDLVPHIGHLPGKWGQELCLFPNNRALWLSLLDGLWACVAFC